MSKRDLKLDCGEDVFEADGMVKWEGVRTFKLCVEGRRRGNGDSAGGCATVPCMPAVQLAAVLIGILCSKTDSSLADSRWHQPLGDLILFC